MWSGGTFICMPKDMTLQARRLLYYCQLCFHQCDFHSFTSFLALVLIIINNPQQSLLHTFCFCFALLFSESVIVSFASHIGTSSKSSLPWSKRVRKAKAILATSICASLTPLPLPTILLQSPPPSIPLRTTSTMVGPRTL